MPVILDSNEIKVIDGDKNFTIETVKSNVIVNQDTEINEPTITAPITPVPLRQYTEERMYPPTRDLASASHLISGESYGNGVYETWESTYLIVEWKAFSAFKTSDNTGYHGAANLYSSGSYLGTNYIVSGYTGDWIKIKLPVSIKLTKYGFKMRPGVSNFKYRAPGQYKIYGSNDNNQWDMLVHKTSEPSYTGQKYEANDYFEESISITNTYQYFAVVVNKLSFAGTGTSSTSGDVLNFDEWYIYGKEFISEDPDYKTLVFTYEAGNETQTSYTVNFPEDTTCDILIVGGGGGGGSSMGGGGGAGGLIFQPNVTLSGQYNVLVGNKGLGATAWYVKGTNGKNSKIYGGNLSLEAYGGGGSQGQSTQWNDGNQSVTSGDGGFTGGSGGGGSRYLTGGGDAIDNPPLNTDDPNQGDQGYDGGTGGYTSSSFGGGGGGGGAGGVGGDVLPGYGGAGGLGLNYSSTFGTSVGDSGWFASGGGGQGYGTGGIATLGGGGYGSTGETNNVPVGKSLNALQGTGGGGGGGHTSGGDGGSGIVIIRYKTQYQTTTHAAQWTYHSANPNTHHYGNVGIGTTPSATQKLLVNGDMNVTGNYKQNDKTIGNWYKNGTSIYRTSGNVGIGNTDPQYSLHVHGGVYAGEGGTTGDGTTVWTSTSDSRMKDNIFKASYKECYDIFKKIELYRYNFKPGYVNSNDRNQLGFIAQEVQQQIPNSVEPRSIILSSGVYIRDILTLNVTQINYILYGTFKYLIAELDIIKTHLESQEEAGQTE